MILEVDRRWKTSQSTCGRLFVEDDDFCFTLEPAVPIPAGIYNLVLQQSEKFTVLYGFPFFTPRLQNVPGFTAIEIHMGNRPENTEGCTIVGSTHPGDDFVGQSDITLVSLLSRLTGEAIAGMSFEDAMKVIGPLCPLPLGTIQYFDVPLPPVNSELGT